MHIVHYVSQSFYFAGTVSERIMFNNVDASYSDNLYIVYYTSFTSCYSILILVLTIDLCIVLV